MGIIAPLQRWTVWKRLERALKIVLRCYCKGQVRAGMSAIEPHEYARRFHLMFGVKLLGFAQEEVVHDWEEESALRRRLAASRPTTQLSSVRVSEMRDGLSSVR